jgi:hypothetical protein
MWLEAQVSDAESTYENFGRYVLSVEMRRFLRDLMGKETWMSRSLAYLMVGDADADSWPDPKWMRENAAELRAVAVSFLGFMTEPNTDAKRFRQAVDSVMSFDAERLHPRYLMYSYEAVAVFLYDHRWIDDDRKLEAKFEEMLRTRIERSMRRLREQELGDVARDDIGRLILQMLDIGFRLRLPKLLRMAERRAGTETGDIGRFEPIREPDTRLGISVIFGAVRRAAPKIARKAGW